MIHRAIQRAAGLVALLALPLAHAQLENYAQDFEALDPMSGSALADDGWQCLLPCSTRPSTRSLQLRSVCGPQWHWRVFPMLLLVRAAPIKVLSKWSRLATTTTAITRSATRSLRLCFRSRPLAPTMRTAGSSRFDAKMGDLQPPSTARAVVRLLDPSSGFALIGEFVLGIHEH